MKPEDKKVTSPFKEAHFKKDERMSPEEVARKQAEDQKKEPSEHAHEEEVKRQQEVAEEITKREPLSQAQDKKDEAEYCSFYQLSDEAREKAMEEYRVYDGVSVKVGHVELFERMMANRDTHFTKDGRISALVAISKNNPKMSVEERKMVIENHMKGVK